MYPILRRHQAGWRIEWHKSSRMITKSSQVVLIFMYINCLVVEIEITETHNWNLPHKNEISFWWKLTVTYPDKRHKCTPILAGEAERKYRKDLKSRKEKWFLIVRNNNSASTFQNKNSGVKKADEFLSVSELSLQVCVSFSVVRAPVVLAPRHIYER